MGPLAPPRARPPAPAARPVTPTTPRPREPAPRPGPGGGRRGLRVLWGGALTHAPGGSAYDGFVWNHITETLLPDTRLFQENHLVWPSQKLTLVPSMCLFEMLLVNVGLQIGQ